MSNLFLTIDLEEYFHSQFIRPYVKEKEARAYKYVELLLKKLNQYKAKSTFFIVSEWAEKNESLLKQISYEGHEIASHTHTHPSLSLIKNDMVFYELEKSKDILSTIINKNIKGFRSPNFDMPKKLFSYLQQLNYVYDSSLCKSKIHMLSNNLIEENKNIKELALESIIPPGGGFLRFIPIKLFEKLVFKKGQNCIVYIHPWELDDYSKIKNSVPTLKYFLHSYNINTVEKKLDYILNKFSSRNLQDLLEKK